MRAWLWQAVVVSLMLVAMYVYPQLTLEAAMHPWGLAWTVVVVVGLIVAGLVLWASRRR